MYDQYTTDTQLDAHRTAGAKTLILSIDRAVTKSTYRQTYWLFIASVNLKK